MRDYVTKARIVTGGVGCFLDPPTYPQHHQSVETYPWNHPQHPNRFMSLESGAEAEYLEPAIRTRCRRILTSWVRPPIDSPEIQDWIHNVLGYFHGCYQGKRELGEESWHAGCLKIDTKLDPMAFIDTHAGGHLIRRFYPEFVPTAEHFANAYWGQKPEPATT